MGDISIEPPNSRLFILCSKSLTEADLRQAFDHYGNVEDVWIVKDKSSNESKGVVYIKFTKSSEAALAMEEMNGKVLGSGSKPIKVMIAHSREQGAKKDDDPERLLRLFIVVPKSMTEDELREHFKQFGEVEYVSIVKNRDTGESKGVAYVKYYRAFHAAKAYEECSKSYKAVFARPREPKVPIVGQYDPPMERMGGGGWIGYGESSMPMASRGGGGGHGDARLLAAVHTSLRQEQVYKLFDIAPGLVDIRPQANAQRNYYNQIQKVLVEYNCPQAASYAAEKLHGFEYPPGHRINIRSASGDLPPPSRGALLPNTPATRMEMNGSGMTTISTSELATLNAALAKAESIIKNRGLAPSGLKTDEEETFDPTYCSVRLPPPQPLAPPPEGTPTFRLFIVCQPGLPSMYALRDIFGRFGDLVEVYTLHGKNCGYVTYASKEAADEAIKKLHLQEVCGMRIKVMVAEPPRGGPDRSDRKRLRIDHDSADA